MRFEHPRTADEQDAFTRWRRVLCYLDRPGVRKKIKRTSHHIDRRRAKRLISEMLA